MTGPTAHAPRPGATTRSPGRDTPRPMSSATTNAAIISTPSSASST